MTASRALGIGLGVLLAGCATHAPSKGDFGGATPLQWSVRMADSEMARRGDTLAWSETNKAKWDYTTGLFTLSLLKLYEYVPDPRYLTFAETTIGSFITSDGDIRRFKLEDYNTDNINPGKTVLALYKLTDEERYKKAAALLRKQLDTHPRTSEGGLWHKQRYPHQMWLDGLYMGSPFYAEYTLTFDGPPADFDDVVKQFRLIDEHLYDPASGLFYHGWDESKEQDWANKVTGTSANFWGRGLGWYAMALVDVLDFLPKDQPGRTNIIAILNRVADGIVKHQDPKTGLWWQVLDQGGRKGNYLEASASSMFVYTLGKGVKRGYLTREYESAIVKGYRGIVERFVKVGDSGQVTLTQCCSVAGLGFGRDGSYDYYLSEPIVDNDLKGVGPFILAGIEMQKLLGLPLSQTAPPSASTPITRTSAAQSSSQSASATSPPTMWTWAAPPTPHHASTASALRRRLVGISRAPCRARRHCRCALLGATGKCRFSKSNPEGRSCGGGMQMRPRVLFVSCHRA